MVNLFKDEGVFDQEYLPGRLPHRDGELRRLLEILGRVVETRIPQHMLIAGGVGTGKTTLARALGRRLIERSVALGRAFDVVYVNCRRDSTDQSALLSVLQHFQVGFPDRGFKLSELLAALARLLRSRNAGLLVILDEAANLLRRSSELVYNLTRGKEVGLGSVSLLLVSLKDPLLLLDESTRSSFGRSNILELEPYTESQLLDILRERSDAGLLPGVASEDVLAMIARSTRSSGDARFAIEVLYSSAKTAQAQSCEHISADHVRAARGETYAVLSDSNLAELDTGHLLALLAAARALKRTGRSEAGTRSVKDAYTATCEEFGERAVSRTGFWRVLKELDARGLISFEPRGHGRTGQVSISEVPVSMLIEKLEGLLRG